MHRQKYSKKQNMRAENSKIGQLLFLSWSLAGLYLNIGQHNLSGLTDAFHIRP